MATKQKAKVYAPPMRKASWNIYSAEAYFYYDLASKLTCVGTKYQEVRETKAGWQSRDCRSAYEHKYEGKPSAVTAKSGAALFVRAQEAAGNGLRYSLAQCEAEADAQFDEQ